MAQQFTYSTYALPSPRTSPTPPAELSTLAARYATLRLEALLTSPQAFASTHAIESKFTPDAWRAVIWRPDAVVLVCVARPADSAGDGGSGLDSGDWVASAILRGPFTAQEYVLNGAAPPADDAETRWQMTAVFASATHRGRGLAKMLIQAGKDYSLAQTAGPAGKTRLRVLIHPDNRAVLSLYSKMGFAETDHTTGQEAYRTNGDLASWELKLQTLTDELKVYWKTARVAVVMEWTGETE
ncbi:hypothetical protein C8R46DRAFT_1352758 [Mycena filopes]|nr:hypothetical protein C8R46DRAFT_1352758 [Mycena filopes]